MKRWISTEQVKPGWFERIEIQELYDFAQTVRHRHNRNTNSLTVRSQCTVRMTRTKLSTTRYTTQHQRLSPTYSVVTVYLPHYYSSLVRTMDRPGRPNKQPGHAWTQPELNKQPEIKQSIGDVKKLPISHQTFQHKQLFLCFVQQQHR